MIIKRADFIECMSMLEALRTDFTYISKELDLIVVHFDKDSTDVLDESFMYGVRAIIKVLASEADVTTAVMRNTLDVFYTNTLESRRERIEGHDPDEHLFDPDKQTEPAKRKGKVKV